MKKLALLFFLMIGQAYCYELNGRWNINLQHELIVSCSKRERFCMNLCYQQKECRFFQPFCRDCIGTGPLITHIFQNLAEAYSKTGRYLTEEELEKFILKKRYVSIETNSPFNVVDDVRSNRFGNILKEMCDGNSEKPLLLASLDNIGSILEVSYLVCQSKGVARVWELSAVPNAEIMLSSRPQY